MSKRHMTRIEDSTDTESLDRQAMERRVAVRSALDKLSPDLRSALVLVDLEDLSTRQAAQVLQVPERTVESRLYHGRKKLRISLDRWLRRWLQSTPAAAPG